MSSERLDIRKLQITGGSTFIISLPKHWVTQMGLKQGSQLALTVQDDNSLRIVPEQLRKFTSQPQAIIEVEPSHQTPAIIRKLISTYLVGFNVINIRPVAGRMPAEQRGAIKDFTRRKLVGTEIVADSPSELVLKVLLGYPELSIQSALRRMAIITSSMHRDALTALGKLDRDLASEISTMDDEVDRFSFYVIRQLKAAVQNEVTIREVGLSSARDCLGYRLITKTIERTADHAVEIAKNILRLTAPIEPPLLEQVLKMSKEATAIFDEAIEALFQKDFDSANSIAQEAKQVASKKGELLDLLLKTTSVDQEVSSMTLVIESVARVAEYASDVAEMALNMNVLDSIITTPE